VSLPTIAPSAVTDALRSIGIKPGSIALVHADAIVAAQFQSQHAGPSLGNDIDNDNDQQLDLLIDAIESAIGREGTLVMPAFSYSFTKGEPFDVVGTPSAVGMVSERFRTRKGVLRTLDPIFSFACSGPLAPQLCALPVEECFGPDSVFAAVHRLNAYIVDLGCSLSRGGTFVHYVETAYGVKYRYKKIFSGIVLMPDGQRVEGSVAYNVRDLTRRSEADLRSLQSRLIKEGKMRAAEVGRSRILAVTASDFFDTAWKMLDEDPLSLIEEGVQV